MENQKMSLYELGVKHNTDKSTYHEYTKFYQKHLESIRYDNLQVLEVGIWNGGSINMWRDYFENSIIHGADILDRTYLNGKRVKISITDQESEEELRKLPKELDLIIDDGGHTMLQQQTTLKVLFLENLKKGGIYILEDLHTSLPHYHGSSFGSNPTNNSLQLLLDLKGGEITEGNAYHITSEDFDRILSEIESIEISYNGPEKDNSVTSIIRKKK